MTDQTTREWPLLAAWDWVVLPTYERLHHLASLDDPDETERYWVGTGRTSCNRRGLLAIPGIFSRMGLPRCQTCCRRAGFPQGTGSPKNDPACRPLVEAELANREPVTAAGGD